MGGGINSFLKATDKKAADWYRDDQKTGETGYSMHLIAREACRLIRDRAPGKPLFLYVTPNSVHTPWLSPEEYQRPYAHLPERRKQLAGMTAAADEAFRQIMAALREKGLASRSDGVSP